MISSYFAFFSFLYDSDDTSNVHYHYYHYYAFFSNTRLINSVTNGFRGSMLTFMDHAEFFQRAEDDVEFLISEDL